MPTKVEISSRTIIFILLLLLGIWFLVQIKEIFIMLFESLILMSALNPFVNKLERNHLPRGAAIIIVYLLVWVVLGAVVALIIPGMIDQTSRLVGELPAALSQIEFFSLLRQDISQQAILLLGSLPQNILKIGLSFFGNVVNILTTIVISFYLILEHKNLERHLGRLLDIPHQSQALRVIEMMERRLGSWVRGEIVLMAIIGIFTYLGLLILGIDSALPLAVLAGLMEIVPNLGPIISSIPALVIALSINPLVAAAVAALYFLVHFLENNLVVPKVMQKAAGVHPLLSILSILIGVRLAGPVGAILAIPFVVIIQTLIPEIPFFYRLKKP